MIVTDKSLLRKVCQLVSTEEGNQIGKLLLSEMKSANGLGLAAPQIGIDARVFSTKFSGQKPFDKEDFFINPVIRGADDPIMFTEGCLSIPGKYTDKIRWNKILISADNINPYWMEGLPAIIAQHEIDHLDGILMDDKIDNVYSQCICGSGKKFKFCHMKKDA